MATSLERSVGDDFGGEVCRESRLAQKFTFAPHTSPGTGTWYIVSQSGLHSLIGRNQLSEDPTQLHGCKRMNYGTSLSWSYRRSSGSLGGKRLRETEIGNTCVAKRLVLVGDGFEAGRSTRRESLSDLTSNG